MRIYLHTTKNKNRVPFDHLRFIVGTIHKWIGNNNPIHGTTSLYSFSWLRGAKSDNEGLQFPNGALWFISAYDEGLIKRIINGIQNDPSINFGLDVVSVVIREEPLFESVQRFTVASPVLVKQTIGEKVKHFTFSEDESDIHLTNTLKTKLQKAGLNSDGVSVCFDRDAPAAKTKKVNYNGIGNMGSICPVVVSGSPEQIAFAWNVGVGNSTGIGFGALN